MRILVTGAAGRLGSRLVSALAARNHEVTGVDVAELDVTDFSAVRQYIADCTPEVVIHAAAWTHVDGCAQEPERAILVNGLGAQHVALGAAQVGAAILYISSNEVFDGRSRRPYYEYDIPNPINAYGYSKWVGEQATIQVNPRHYIVRTAWLFAHGGRNFIQTILNAAKSGQALRVVTDEVANPTYNDDLVTAVAQLIQTGRYGIYHLANQGACSRYTFARYFLDRAGFADTVIERISIRQWPRPSTPPAYTSLHNMAGKVVGISLRPWQEAVDAFLEREGLLAGDGR